MAGPPLPDLPGLVVWLDAAQITGLADGDPVESWPNLAETENFTQPTAANRPTFQTGVQNGLPGILFDGSDDRLDGSVGRILQPATVFAVVRLDLTAATFYEFQGSTTLVKALHSRVSGTTNAVEVYNRPPYLTIGGEMVGGDAEVPTVWDYSYGSAGEWAIGRQGSTLASGTTVDTITTPTVLRIGDRATLDYPWSGLIHEVLIYDTVLGAGDRQAVRNYLVGKWLTPWPEPRPFGWRSRVDLRVELGVHTGSLWDTGLWGTATWVGPEPLWQALDGAHVEALTVRRGRDDAADRMGTGTATATLTWPLADGAWSFRDTAPVSVGSELRVSASVDGGANIPVWRGRVNTLTDTWSPGSDRLGVRVTMTDRLADLAAVAVPELDTPVGAGELPGARVNRVLDAADIDGAFVAQPDVSRWGIALWGSGEWADNPDGTSPLQATTLPAGLLEEAWKATDAEPGVLFVDRAGLFTFRTRLWPTEGRSAVSRLVWSNTNPDPTASPPELAPAGFDSGVSLELMANEVTRARAGGDPITLRDEESIIRHGRRTNTVTDLINQDDADVAVVAGTVLADRANRLRTVGPLTAVVNPSLPAAALETLIDIELLDRHTVVWADGADDPVTMAAHVQRVDHDVTPEQWTVTVGVWEVAS